MVGEDKDEVVNEELEDDYLDDEIPGRHISISSVVLVVLTFLLIGIVSFTGYSIYTEYNSIFPSEWCSCRVNETYLSKIDKLGSEDKSYIVSPLGLDLSLIELSGEKGFEPTQRLSIISNSNRGYKSLGSSDQKLFELVEEEKYKIYKNIGKNTGTEISDYLGIDYELDKSFLNSDALSVIKLPTELKGDISHFDGEVYITGNYFKSSGAFKVEYKDNLHEVIFYKDSLPDEDDWESTNGTLVVPETSATYTTSSLQTINSLFGNNSDKVSLTQVIHFELTGEKEPENLEYNNKVGSPYNVVIRNTETGMIIAGGVIRDE